jgi:hypothetical protein
MFGLLSTGYVSLINKLYIREYERGYRQEINISDIERDHIEIQYLENKEPSNIKYNISS